MIDPINWTSRSIPMGNDNPIEIATLTFKVPILINPPAKVKRQAIIEEIITDITSGHRLDDSMEWCIGDFISRTVTTPSDAIIKVEPIGGCEYALYLCDKYGESIDLKKSLIH